MAQNDILLAQENASSDFLYRTISASTENHALLLNSSKIPEFRALAISDVTSLQTSLDGKASSSHTHTLSNITDFPSSVSATELGYLDGVTSAIQTQLNGKQDILVSGTNIKTINGNSLLGSGNIVAGSVWSTIIINTIELTATGNVNGMNVAIPANAYFTIRLTCELELVASAGRLSVKPSQTISYSYNYWNSFSVGAPVGGKVDNSSAEQYLSANMSGANRYSNNIVIQGKNNGTICQFQFRLTCTASTKLNNVVLDYMTY